MGLGQAIQNWAENVGLISKPQTTGYSADFSVSALAEEYIEAIALTPESNAELKTLAAKKYPRSKFERGKYDVRTDMDWVKIAADFGDDYHRLYHPDTVPTKEQPNELAHKIAARRAVITPLIWMEGNSPKIAEDGTYERDTQLPWSKIFAKYRVPSAFLQSTVNIFDKNYPYKFFGKRLKRWTNFGNNLSGDQKGEIIDPRNGFAKASAQHFYEWGLSRFAHKIKKNLDNNPASLIESKDPAEYLRNLRSLTDMIRNGYLNGPQLEIFMQNANQATRDFALMGLGQHIAVTNISIAQNPEQQGGLALFHDEQLFGAIEDALKRTNSHGRFIKQRIATNQEIGPGDIAAYHQAKLSGQTSASVLTQRNASTNVGPIGNNVFIIDLPNGNFPETINLFQNTRGSSAPLASPASAPVSNPDYPLPVALHGSDGDGNKIGLSHWGDHSAKAYKERHEKPFKGLTRGQQQLQSIIAGSDLLFEVSSNPGFMIQQFRIIKEQASRGDEDAKIINLAVRQSILRAAGKLLTDLTGGR